jgi:hypothetical protein
MPSPSLPATIAGFASARRAAHRAWLLLAAVAAVPGWAAARIVPGFLAVDTSPPLSDGAPNLWAIIQMLPWIGGLPLTGLAMTMAFGAAAWLMAHFSAHPPRGEALARAALLIALLVPGLLPRMQPHDFLLAAVLSIITGLQARNATLAGLVVGGWLLAVLGVGVLGAVPVLVATLWLARSFLASPANDNGLPLNIVMAYPA